MVEIGLSAELRGQQARPHQGHVTQQGDFVGVTQQGDFVGVTQQGDFV